MDTSIVIMVDNKQKMIDVLQAEIDNGENYANLCIQVLIDEWGADPAKIDHQRIIQGASGHLIHHKMRGLEVESPSEYVKSILASYSNYGLEKRGLTRAQYNKLINAELTTP